MMVYAQWTGETYTVTFKSNYDPNDTLDTKTVTVPAMTIGSANFPYNPSRSGYTFVGWNTQANDSGFATAFTASTLINADITVYAQWITTPTPPGSSTVLFALNDETDTYWAHKTIPASTAIGLSEFPTDPTRTGYNFGGWYTEPDGGGSEFTATTTVTASIIVYAKWNPYSYTVTFDATEGTLGSPATTTVASPAINVGSLSAPPARTGYNFGGWYTGTNGGGSEFTATTTVTASITVYAKWDTYSYTVTFNKSGGDTEANPATKTVASPETDVDSLPAPPTRRGYNFDGWYTGTNGGGSEFTVTTPVIASITVYAKWTMNGWNITLNPDDGDGVFSQQDFTLSKGGNGLTSQSITITGTGYTDPRWYVDGTLKGTTSSITINAADYPVGGHTLALFISKNGVDWSKEIAFTVTD
jgi:uncharacterized repeat protein (TIGR02543 family)